MKIEREFRWVGLAEQLGFDLSKWPARTVSAYYFKSSIISELACLYRQRMGTKLSFSPRFARIRVFEDPGFEPVRLTYSLDFKSKRWGDLDSARFESTPVPLSSDEFDSFKDLARGGVRKVRFDVSERKSSDFLVTIDRVDSVSNFRQQLSGEILIVELELTEGCTISREDLERLMGHAPADQFDSNDLAYFYQRLLRKCCLLTPESTLSKQLGMRRMARKGIDESQVLLKLRQFYLSQTPA